MNYISSDVLNSSLGIVINCYVQRQARTTFGHCYDILVQDDLVHFQHIINAEMDNQAQNEICFYPISNHSNSQQIIKGYSLCFENEIDIRHIAILGFENGKVLAVEISFQSKQTNMKIVSD